MIIEEKKLEEILDLLAGIGQGDDLKKTYETLCKILHNYLLENLNENTNQFFGKKNYEIKIDDLELTCDYEKISMEIDSVGKLRKPITINDNKVSLSSGIQSLEEYINFKKKDDKESMEKYINNDFKCPIIFKNFLEHIIPGNKCILCEIKSGFGLKDVIEQINKRINIIKDCLFSGEEKPEYYLGIVNINSKDFEKLETFLNQEPKFDEKVLIISAVDFEYHGFDLCSEVNENYLLYQKMENIETKLDEFYLDLTNKQTKLDEHFIGMKTEMNNN